MPSHGIDISWDVLRHVIRGWAGSSADLVEVTPLEGGCVNTTVAVLLDDRRRVVLKITPHRVDPSHANEAAQLALLREVGLPVPEVYAAQVGTLDNPFSFILMEFVEGVDLSAARATCSDEEFDGLQSQLADLLLKLHAHTHSHYWRVSSDPQPPRFESWPEFYRDMFDAIWREVEKSNVLPVKCRKIVARVHDRLDRLIAPDDKPRLLHWDIWATNLLCLRDGEGAWRIRAMLDPNCKYGHAEAEIAYLELFHTATPTFLKAYQQQRRLGPDYHQVRKPVYQLYRLLNHLRLFGPEYLKPTLAAIEKVGALV